MRAFFIFIAVIGFNFEMAVSQTDTVVENAEDPNVIFFQANEAYKNDDFESSAALYLKILNEGVESAEVYFNLGNIYFKMGDMPNAILHYEKAKKLDPQDEDLLTNLQMANLKTTDKVEAKPELVINTWWKSILNIYTVDEWAKKSIYLSFIALSFLILFVITEGMIKRISFFGGIGIFGFSLLLYFMAQQQKSLQSSDQYGIIFTSSVTVKSAPEEDGTKIFVIHEGTKIRVLESSGEWSRISLMNENKGWIKTLDFKGI